MLANATVTEPSGAGFLTLWNCSDTRPEVSTLNFSTDQTVANTATIPLDSSGGLCAFSSVSTDLLIDVGGYYSLIRHRTLPAAFAEAPDGQPRGDRRSVEARRRPDGRTVGGRCRRHPGEAPAQSPST